MENGILGLGDVRGEEGDGVGADLGCGLCDSEGVESLGDAVADIGRGGCVRVGLKACVVERQVRQGLVSVGDIGGVYDEALAPSRACAPAFAAVVGCLCHESRVLPG